MFNSKLDRKHCRMLVGLLAGHILQYMLHKMREKTSLCRKGNVGTHSIWMPGTEKDKDADFGLCEDGSGANKRRIWAVSWPMIGGLNYWLALYKLEKDRANGPVKNFTKEILQNFLKIFFWLFKEDLGKIWRLLVNNLHGILAQFQGNFRDMLEKYEMI